MRKQNSLPFEVTPEHVARRQRAVLDTVRHHELDKGRAAVIGGAGLALYGLSNGVPMLDAEIGPRRGHEPFDVDAFAVPGTDAWPRGPFGKRTRRTDAIPAKGVLPVTLLRGDRARQLAFSTFDASSLEGLLAGATEIDGVGVLSLGQLARSKWRSGRPKDMAGLVGAHMIGAEHGNAVIRDPEWQEVIGNVVNRLSHSMVAGHDPMLPSWLNDQVARRFDHPAFEPMHQPIPAQRRAA